MATVKLSRDLLQATLVLEPEEQLSPVEAMALLNRRGVVHGVRLEAVLALAGRFGPLEQVVAVGDAPVHGQDATVEYLFRTDDRDLAPVIDRFDQADYRNLGLIANVAPGQLLARRKPPVPGRNGTSVNGLSLAARRARDLALTAGPGTVLNAEGTHLYAVKGGTPRLSGRTVSVHQRLRLPGSVGLATGNITFDGDLEIAGDVEMLMEVKVTGSVLIHGSVTGARVTAGGSVTIKGKALQNAEIKAGGALTVGFAEFVRLESEGALRVRENVIHCHARANGPIEVGGAIVGGIAASQSRIAAGSIGAPVGVPTVVMVEPNAAAQQALKVLFEERTGVHEQLVVISQRLRRAMERRSHLTAQALLDLIGTFNQLSERKAELEAEEGRIQAAIAPSRCPIAARFGIHPEVDVRLGETHMRVTEAYLADALWEGRPVELL